MILPYNHKQLFPARSHSILFYALFRSCAPPPQIKSMCFNRMGLGRSSSYLETVFNPCGEAPYASKTTQEISMAQYKSLRI